MQFPAISQGTADYFWDSSLSLADKVKLLQEGLDLGMNLIDTAEVYGKGISEEIVGKAISGCRSQVLVASKFSPEHHTYNQVIEAAEGSLRRLGTDYMDLYQIHWSNPVVPISETMGALQDLVRQGKIREVGVCNISYDELLQYQEELSTSRIISLQSEYNLYERTAEYTGLLNDCINGDVTFMAYSPLDQGRLTSLGSNRSNLLEEISNKYQKSIAQIVLKWVISKPGVSAIVSTSSTKHLVENATVLNFDLLQRDIDAIDTEFHEELIHVETNEIRISLNGEFNHSVYQTLEQALENPYGFTPSPSDLAKTMKKGQIIKPVRLVPSEAKSYQYDLIGGRVRYWAWVIAHEGKLPIPAYVRNDLA